MVSVFPVIGNAGVAENKSDQLGKTCFGADVVREDEDAALTGFDTDHGVGGLAVMAALEETVALGAVEEDDAQTGVEVFALPSCACPVIISGSSANR